MHLPPFRTFLQTHRHTHAHTHYSPQFVNQLDYNLMKQTAFTVSLFVSALSAVGDYHVGLV